MTVGTAMVLAAAVLPYLCTAGAKFGGRGYDNADPRGFLSRLTGWRARADGAQRNGFEAFAPFAAAVLLAQQAGAPQGRTDALAVAFVVVRVLYVAVYIAGVAWLRTLMFGLGFLCVILLFVSA